MPNGYTAPVMDGSITDLDGYVLTCARAFMPLILLRDSDQSLDATKRFLHEDAYLEGDYAQKQLDRARATIAELTAMSDDEVLAAATAEAESVMEANQQSVAEAETVCRRYEAMLAKVEEWDPPTIEHEPLKTFMEEQLRHSMLQDARAFERPVPSVGPEWRDKQLASLHSTVAHYEEQVRVQAERNEKRKQWVEDLLASLEPVPA